MYRMTRREWQEYERMERRKKFESIKYKLISILVLILSYVIYKLFADFNGEAVGSFLVVSIPCAIAMWFDKGEER